MKKYVFLIVFSLSLLFLLPLDTYADSNNAWYAPYDESHSLVSQNGYYGSRYSNVAINSSTNDISFYFDNVSFNSAAYDYIELQVYVQFTGYQGNESVADENIITNQYGDYIVNNDTILSFTANEKAGVNDSVALCTFFPSGVVSSHTYSGILRCNVNQGSDSLTSINLRYNFINPNFGSSGTYSIFFGSTGWINYIRKNNLSTDTIVQGQQATTNAINDMNDNINDSSTNDANTKGSSFFANFGNHDNAHLTTIITAPLRLFSAMQTECTQPLSIPLSFTNLNNSTGANIGSTNIPIACYANFWNREDVQTFRVFWNLLIGGPCIYGLLVLLMKAYNNALDPLNDALITIDLNQSSPTMDEVNDSYYHALKGRETRADRTKLTTIFKRGGKS